MSYKDNYKNIKAITILLVRKLIRNFRYYRRTDEDKFFALTLILDSLNHIYGTSTRLRRTRKNTSGSYSFTDKTIYLNKLSLVTFLHEFKHSLQHQKGRKDTEEMARGWSVSLFYLASPYHYNRAVRKGLLLYS